MSDQTVAPNASEQAPSDDNSTLALVGKKGTGPARTRKTSAPKDSFSVTDLARARLRKRGVKTDDRLADECKVVRGILRSNFTFVAKNDATVRKAKDAPNDRKPWPTNMGKHTFAVAVEGKRAPQGK